MADLAAWFHWRPSEMDGMDLVEIASWREKGRVRCERNG